MKNQIAILLGLGLLALPASMGMAQVSKAAAAPPAPTAPVPPKPPVDDLSENVNEIVEQAKQMARDATSYARAGVNQRLQSVIARVGPAPSGTLVIPKDEADAKTLNESEEDMNIMAHILDKIASSPDGKSRRAMGISVRGPFEMGGSPRNLYIDGYGAIFFLNVSYPLSAPPAGKEQPEAKEEPPSEWDEARRELYQPPQSNSELKWNEPDLKSFDYFAIAGSPEPYDAERVEQLQKSLVTDLKNASHMRNLKSHDTVTVVVTGRSPGSGQRVTVSRKSSGGGGGGGGGFGGSSSGRPSNPMTSRPSGPESRKNQMLIRASKSDIEAFQNEKLSYDEFRKKVTVLIY